MPMTDGSRWSGTASTTRQPLATVSLRMAVASGTDMPMRSADIILVRRSLDVIPDAIELSRRTLRTVRGNLVWAFGYNVAAIPLAVMGHLNPLIAGFVDVAIQRLRGHELHAVAANQGHIELTRPQLLAVCDDCWGCWQAEPEPH